MSNSQNKKNEQQNNLCTTLTEQWKKGELPDGLYYCKLACFNYEPTIANKSLEKENQQLKELLKECREYIKTEQKMLVECSPFWEKLMNNLLSKIDEVLK